MTLAVTVASVVSLEARMTVVSTRRGPESATAPTAGAPPSLSAAGGVTVRVTGSLSSTSTVSLPETRPWPLAVMSTDWVPSKPTSLTGVMLKVAERLPAVRVTLELTVASAVFPETR